MALAVGRVRLDRAAGRHGIEGGAQLGGVITDGEVCMAIGLLAAAVVFMRLGFAAQDREKQTKKIHQQPGNTVQRSRRAG